MQPNVQSNQENVFEGLSMCVHAHTHTHTEAMEKKEQSRKRLKVVINRLCTMPACGTKLRYKKLNAGEFLKFRFSECPPTRILKVSHGNQKRIPNSIREREICEAEVLEASLGRQHPIVCRGIC